MSKNTKQILEKLSEEVRTSRVKENVAFKWGPVIKWFGKTDEKIKGLWPSILFVRLGIQRSSKNPLTKALKERVEKFSATLDFNFYANIWIFLNILEAQKLGFDFGFDEDELPETWSVLSKNFRSAKNSTSPAIYFWPKLIPSDHNKNVQASLPTNAKAKTVIITEVTMTLSKIAKLINSSRLERRLALNVVKKNNVMSVPEDFDDSSLFIASNYCLENSYFQQKSTENNSSYIEKFAELLLGYAYIPFSKDFSESTIDTRTYFWLRHYLQDVVRKSDEDGTTPHVVLPTTWIQSLNEALAIERLEKGEHQIPLCTNNVEASVCANVLYALTHALNSESSTSWFDAKVQKLYGDTLSLIVWLIETEMVNKRPDIVLLYYPDVEVFYYFVARALGQLRLISPEKMAMYLVLRDGYNRLENAMQKATTILIENSTSTGKNDELVFWDGVLGEGKDRLFITATCINTLFDAWTVRTKSGDFKFLPDSPPALKKILQKSHSFLCEHAISGDYLYKNALFSGSLKSIWTRPQRYPANTIMYGDGVRIDGGDMSFSDLKDSVVNRGSKCIFGFTGFIPETDYKKLIDNRQFGLEMGTERHPYTNISYWSVEDASRTMIILALAKYGQCSELHKE